MPLGNSYAGGDYYYIQFTNLSGHACTLRGYPGVSAVSLSGQQIGSPARWGSPSTTTVTLANGATAHANLQVADPADYGTRGHRPARPARQAGDIPDSSRILRLPAGRDRIQSNPVSVRRLRAHRPGLDERGSHHTRRCSC